MSKFIIDGGRQLNGTITASGNKNAALALLPACLLTDEPVILHNIPEIQDVRTTLCILDDLGVDVQKVGPNSWRLHAATIKKTTLDRSLAGRIRASFVFSGPMLARTGRITLPIPGGDVIGGRPLDTHVQGLRALGAEVVLDEQAALFHITADSLRRAGNLLQAEASVTGTENTIMAAVFADGETTIENAASEPHVRDLCNFLNSLGADIEGIGTNRIVIRGVERLGGGEFTIGADFMEVGSFIGAAAVTGGQVRIKNASPYDLRMIRLVYERLGVSMEVDGEDIVVPPEQTMNIESA